MSDTKKWKTRVEVSIMLEVESEGDTEQEAGADAEDYAFFLAEGWARELDGCCDPWTYAASWSVMATSVELEEEDEEND